MARGLTGWWDVTHARNVGTRSPKGIGQSTDQPVCNGPDLLQNLENPTKQWMSHRCKWVIFALQSRRQERSRATARPNCVRGELSSDALKANQSIPAESSWGAKSLARATPARTCKESTLVMLREHADRRCARVPLFGVSPFCGWCASSPPEDTNLSLNVCGAQTARQPYKRTSCSVGTCMAWVNMCFWTCKWGTVTAYSARSSSEGNSVCHPQWALMDFWHLANTAAGAPAQILLQYKKIVL